MARENPHWGNERIRGRVGGPVRHGLPGSPLIDPSQNTEEEHGSGRSTVPHPMLGAPISSLLTWVAGDPTELLSAHTPCTL
jgi:hypothetical protein